MNRNVRILRGVLVVVVVVLAAMQLVPVDRSNPPVRSEVPAPPEVRAVLRRACYDCHSNETRWPWYSRVAPMSWFVASHVRKGRGDLNFSEWPVFDQQLQETALHDVWEQVSKRKMPLRSYTIMHRDADLDARGRDVLLRWARKAEKDT